MKHIDHAIISINGVELNGLKDVEIGPPELTWRDLPRVYFPKGTSRQKRLGIQAIVDRLIRDIYEREGILLRVTLNTGRKLQLEAPELALPIELNWEANDLRLDTVPPQ